MKTQKKLDLYDKLVRNYETLINDVKAHIQHSNEISEYRCFDPETDGDNRYLWANVQHYGINYLLDLKVKKSAEALQNYLDSDNA